MTTEQLLVFVILAGTVGLFVWGRLRYDLVALMSAFMKNIGALAIMMPVAFQIAKRSGQPVSNLLMPMSFAALLGGLITLIGTSPNIIASRMREEILGKPFGMFDFAPVGLALTAVGIVFLAFGWRLLPKPHKSAASPDELFSVAGYQAEVRVPAESPFVNKTVQAFEEAGEGDVSVAAIVREGGRRYVPSANWTIYEDDVLILLCDAHALSRIVSAVVRVRADELSERLGTLGLLPLAGTPRQARSIVPSSGRAPDPAGRDDPRQ